MAYWPGGTKLRGVNIYQRKVYPELDGNVYMGKGFIGPPYIQEDFDRLSALGANYVIISHPGIFTEDFPYHPEEVIQNLNVILDRVENADMFAVISFRTGPGRSEFTFFWDEVGDWVGANYLNHNVWKDPEAQATWADMWRYTAELYRDNPIVLGYDLMVEPNANEVGIDVLEDNLDIFDPHYFYVSYEDTMYDWNQFYPKIVESIRTVDQETPILVGGMGYSAINWLPYLRPVNDDRILYMVHQYDPYDYTHQKPHGRKVVYPEDVQQEYLEGLIDTMISYSENYQVPVACNEFGAVRWSPGGYQYLDDLMGLFDQQGYNHAIWVWHPLLEPYNQKVHAFNFRTGSGPKHWEDNPHNDLLRIIQKYWARNTCRPSQPILMH